jgi:hypothetical protein
MVMFMVNGRTYPRHVSVVTSSTEVLRSAAGQSGRVCVQSGVRAALTDVLLFLNPLLLLQTVYPDAYRLRILNGCNSRTLQLRFAR